MRRVGDGEEGEEGGWMEMLDAEALGEGRAAVFGVVVVVVVVVGGGIDDDSVSSALDAVDK